MGLFFLMENEDIPKEHLRLIYGEIVRGSSYFYSPAFGEVIIKHLTQQDTELLDVKKLKYKTKAEEKGLPTEEERVQDLIKEKIWSKEKEDQIEASKSFISRMQDTQKKMVLKSERQRVQKDIEDESDKLEKILVERVDLIGLTSEEYSNKKVNDYYIYVSLFKDREFKQPLFSEEEFDEVSEKDLSNIIYNFNKVSKKFKERTIKRIAVSHFFLNNFYLCKDNPFIYYGKPVVELSYHQADLFSFGRYYKQLMQDMKSPLTNEMMDDPDKITEQYDIEQNKEKVLKETSKEGEATTVVGATKEDLEALGVSAEQNVGETVNLNDEIQKKGGVMTMEEIMKLHGH